MNVKLPINPLNEGEEKFYTGVGSRAIDFDIDFLMKRCGYVLANLGYILRSGGAEGSDKAFEDGCDQIDDSLKRIWRPKHATPEAIEIAKQYHGRWDLVTEHAAKLHGRNIFQVLGRSLEVPSEFVLCYTHDGCTNHKDRTAKTGGTGTAISVASERGIPIFNLKLARHRKIVEEWLRRFR
ncbi:MAG: hypothetical protein ACTSW7_00995 [Candidatus Thorarchaeota archaeon]|nr:MAG: hypothetical protein DRQ25_04810 [Candidatus Fermentibacteria bacterium]HEC72047.1 hypothetical protein [Thermoplasmatales archaeon]